MAKLCMGCMNPLPEGNTVCSVCGYDPAVDKNPEHCLPVTASLQGHYIVGRLMAERSDHLLYLGYDRQLREPCFIQEFFPAGVGHRDSIGGVQPLEGQEAVYEEYANQFRSTMRTLARMRDLPAVVPVYDIFEENGTVYAASDYCQGMTLTKKIKMAGGRLTWAEARPLFMALLTTVIHLNDAGICHLAICPDNILIGADGKARLRGFSIPATHQEGTGLPADLRTGYAAPEQYSAEGQVGVAADVYAVAATVFRTVTGNEPPAGNNRAKNSDDLFMTAEVAEELTQQVCVALFNALQVKPENRTGTMAELRDQMSLTPTVSALVDEVEEDMEQVEEQNKKGGKKKGKIALFIGLGVLAVAVVTLVLILLLGGGNQPEEPQGDATTTPAPTFSTTAPKTTDDSKKAVVDNVLGMNYYDVRDIDFNGEMNVVLDHMIFSDKPAGTILSQDPEAGKEVASGSQIKVVISSGQKDESLQVPDVSGWKAEHAELYLKALGFRVERVEINISTYDKGLVDSTDPKAGTVKRLGDKLTLRVSNVETTTTMAPTHASDTVPTSSEVPTLSTDSTTGTTESTTVPTDSTTESTDSTTDTTGDTTDSTDSTADPTGDTTDPTGDTTDPTGDTTDPTADTSDPTAGTDPTGDSTDPTASTDPTDPTIGEITE